MASNLRNRVVVINKTREETGKWEPMEGEEKACQTAFESENSTCEEVLFQDYKRSLLFTEQINKIHEMRRQK